MDPLFVDKHGAQPETTEPSAEPTQSSSETAVTTSAPKTSGAELVTYESSITSETSASASVSESSSSVSYNVLSNNTTTVSRNAGVGLTTTQRTGAPLTGFKKALTLLLSVWLLPVLRQLHQRSKERKTNN